MAVHPRSEAGARLGRDGGAGAHDLRDHEGELPTMARLVGVDLPREKRLEIALTYIFGIGRTRAIETLERDRRSALTSASTRPDRRRARPAARLDRGQLQGRG